jgi:hypothetical protein
MVTLLSLIHGTELLMSFQSVSIVDDLFFRGNKLVQCSDRENELGICEIDLSYMEEVARRLPAWEHRREEVYEKDVIVHRNSPSSG